ncbi:MAG: Flp pilus assembly protein CpaB [Rhizobiaceae bacterium]|jgi:pilus assembly protein CpaB|nr:Flp pilus assembly protein CpaB [Rhizobiaceae bacterium]
MKVAQLAVLGVAFVAAGGAAMVANNLTSVEPVPVVTEVPSVPQIDLEEVLVASQDIPLGTSLRADMLEWKKWPKEGVADGFVSRSDSPDGLDLDELPAIARSAFFAGEPVRQSKLVRSGNGYMSAILPTGQRAIATSISTATGAGGFILPNDRVDVIMTRQGDEATGANQYVTETILENIRVLAIDQTVEEKDGESVVVGETATLQLSPRQAQILTVAQQIADRLTLSLRSLEDSDEEPSKGAEHLLSGETGNGRVAIIRFGNKKEVIARPKKASE